MLFLLDKNVRTVKWNGIPLHETSSAIVKEEINGDFLLNVRYSITDSGIYQLIKEDMLIKAPVPVLGAQLFRIKKPVENDDSLDITAYHISDDIMRRSIKPISVVQLGCATALSQMVQNAKTDLGDFSFTSDISDNRTFNTTETETLYSVLMDGKHSIVGTWEGELVRDNFALSIKRNRGADRGVIITTHKNLKSYQRTKNSQNVVTRIHARSTFKPEGAEDEVALKVTVDSPLINSYPYINEKEYENNNAKTIDDLRKWAEAKFKNDGIDKVSDAIKIEAYELDGQVVHIGDTVNLKSRKHSADLYKKAIAYEFNALTEEYISITFDDKPGVGGSGMSSGLSNAADAILGASATAQDVAIERALKNADAAFDAEFNKRSEAIKDDIEKIKAHAEAIKAAMTDQLNLKINQSKSEVTDRLQKEFNQKLSSTSADLTAVRANLTQAQSRFSGDISQIQSDIAAIRGKQSQADNELAKQVQSINQAKSELAGVKTNLTQAQSQLSSNIAQIRSDVGSIRTKQSQAEAEIGKQVQALNATKTELVGVKSAQATFEQTTTRRLAELANVADGKANRSELVQTATELSSKIASVHLGRRNLLKGTKELARYKPVSEYNGFKVIRTVAGATSYRDSYVERTVIPTTGTEYIAIFYARASENDYPMRCHFYSPNTVTLSENSSGYTSKSSDGLSIIRLSTDWQLCWVKWRQTAIDQAKTVIIGRHGPQVGGKEGAWVEICAPALFEGNMIGDWSPAPEDQDERVSAIESSFKQRADSLEAGVSSLREGLKTKADSSALTVLSDSIKQSVKSLETDTDNKLNQKLSIAQFEVRATGIRQEIVNATKDKADKALVTAEAGRLREELASLSVGENLFINSEFKNLRDNGQRYTANGRTYQNMIAPYWYNPYNAGLPNAQNIQHGYFDTETFSDTVFAFNESDGSRHWKALSTDFKIGVITVGEYYFSADLYAAGLGTYIVVGFYYHDASGKMNFYSGRKRIDVNEKGRWIRLGIDLKVNDDIDLTKKVQFYIYGYNFSTNSILYIKKPKVSKGRLKSDWSPAPEDVDGLITEAKATFERTAQGLRTDLSAVQAYVNADGTRAEALRSYSREETARQLTAERKAIEAGYVGKATYTEDVKGISRRFEELTEGGVNLLRNSATLLLTGDWRTGKWQATSGGNGTAQVVPVTSPPNPLIKSMIRVVNNTVGNKDLSQSAMALVVGQKYTVSCYARVASDSPSSTIGLLIRSWANDNDTNRKLYKTISNREWQRYSFTFTADVVTNSIQFGQSGAGSVEICAPKIELGAVATSWSPSPEDATSYADTKLAEYRQTVEGQLANVQAALNTANGSLTSFNTWKQSAQETLNKVGRVETGLSLVKTSLAEFKQTAQGLRTDLSAVQAYVNADGTRAEALRSYSREETARQLTAERKAIEAGYVGKATYTEDVKGISRRFEELKTSSETKLAEYRQTVEGQFATMSSQIGETIKKSDISITPGQIILGTGKVVNGQTLASLFVQNPQSIEAITKLMRITGDLIVDGSITGRDLAAGAITTPHLGAGAVTAEVIGANAVTADKVKADDALLEKLSAGEALLRKLMAKDAFINRLQSIDFTAEQIKGGLLRSIDGSLIFDLNKNTLTMSSNTAAIKRVLPGHPTQFMRYETERKGNVDYTRTIIGSNRNGSEKFDSVTFAGLVVENSNKAGIEDSLRLYGDNTYFRHAQGEVGWNINAVTQRMSPATWQKESAIWSRSFVVPKHRTPNGRDWVKLEETVAALWRLWEHAAGNQVTMTGAMRDKVRELFQNYGYNYGIS